MGAICSFLTLPPPTPRSRPHRNPAYHRPPASAAILLKARNAATPARILFGHRRSVDARRDHLVHPAYPVGAGAVRRPSTPSRSCSIAALYRCSSWWPFWRSVVAATPAMLSFAHQFPVSISGATSFTTSGQYSWFYALPLLPLVQITAIDFSTPIWTVLLAALFLRERLTGRRIVAVLLGFCGVLVILRPGVATFEPAGPDRPRRGVLLRHRRSSSPSE